MRPLLLTATLLTLAGAAQAQSWETSTHMGGTAFRFRGASAGERSFINNGGTAGSSTNNPYGTRLGVGYGIGLQQQRVTRTNTLLGLQAGYERLRSRIDLEQGLPLADDLLTIGRGQTELIHDFVNLHPYAGQRFSVGPLSLDVTAGLDLGLLLHCQEKGSVAVAGGPRYVTDRERTQPRLDTRARLDVTAYYQHFGLQLGYAHGLRNYQENQAGGNGAYAQVWRLGAVYRLSY